MRMAMRTFSAALVISILLFSCSGMRPVTADTFDPTTRATATGQVTEWTMETVDTFHDVGGFTSLAIDPGDVVHICYYDFTDSDLKYATNAEGGWDIQTVDSDGFVGQYASLALDSSNHAHVSYCDLANGDLRYATNIGGSWFSLTIDRMGDVGQYTSIAVDSLDKVHISYYDNSASDLKYASNAPGHWSFLTLNSTGTVGEWSSITLDSRNRAHISYYQAEDDALMYATNASGRWTTGVVHEGGGGSFSSIALDSTEKVHISFHTTDAGGCGDLGYVTNEDGRWDHVLVDQCPGNVVSQGTGGHTSIALDRSDHALIAYHDFIEKDLRFASDRGGSWSIRTIDSVGDVGTYASLALDSRGLARIAYYDWTNGDLKLATEVTVPSAPRGLNATAGNNSMDINWTLPSYTGPGTVTYHLYRNGSEIWYGTATSYRDEGVEKGIEYNYTVAAQNSVGRGPGSIAVTGVPLGVPSQPANLTAGAGLAYAHLSWEEPDYAGPGTLVYRLFRNGTLIWSGATTNNNDTGVTVETAYRYELSAENDIGRGENSSIDVTIPAGELIPPGAPSDLRMLPGDGNLTLTWNAPEDTGTGPVVLYNIYRGNSSDPLDLIGNVTGTVFVDTNLTNGQTYHYKLSAVSNVGESTLTDIISGTPSSPSGTLDLGMFAIIAVVGIISALGMGSFLLHKRRGG